MSSLPLSGDPRLLEQLTGLAARAAAAILAVAPEACDPRLKADQSPVTAADEAGALGGLARLLPGVPVVSEEATARPTALPSCFVLVDPLDGTREFLAGRPEFTVNIAMIADGRPVLGVVAGPALGHIWRGMAGHGAGRLGLDAGA